MPGAIIVIDPVDKSRNVASALSVQKMCEFIAASREFLRKPSLEFFFPPETSARRDDIVSLLNARGTDIIALITRVPQLAEDIIWGQIYKSLDGIEKLLKRFDFKVLSKGSWLSPENNLFLLFELERGELPLVQKHYGPPVTSKNADSFLNKYLNSSDTIAGPYVESDRWVVFRKRKYSKARDLLRERFSEARLGKHILDSLLKEMKIAQNYEILEYLKKKGFKEYFYSWLSKRPQWLKK